MALRRFSICWPDTQPLRALLLRQQSFSTVFVQAGVDLPVLVLPAGVVLNLDPGGKADLALLQLDLVVLALLVLANGPVVGRDLCRRMLTHEARLEVLGPLIVVGVQDMDGSVMSSQARRSETVMRVREGVRKVAPRCGAPTRSQHMIRLTNTILGRHLEYLIPKRFFGGCC